jgi:hypothetical protein
MWVFLYVVNLVHHVYFPFWAWATETSTMFRKLLQICQVTIKVHCFPKKMKICTRAAKYHSSNVAKYGLSIERASSSNGGQSNYQCCMVIRNGTKLPPSPTLSGWFFDLIIDCRQFLLTWQHAIGWELPRLYYVSCWLVTSLYLPNSFCTFLITGWLSLITHAFLCPITCKLGALRQLIMSSNWLEQS